MAGEKDFIVKNSLQIGGGDLVISKDSDGDLEVKNSSGTLKTLKVDKIELGTGSDVVLLEKDSSGRFKQSVKNKSTKATAEAAPEFLIDEDNMASNSATKVPSQQSVKAYVDSQVASKDNTDEITEGSTNLYFTNARADARVQAAIVDEDNMVSDSATKVPSQQSVKAYVDSQVASKDALSELSGDTDDVSEGSTNLYYTDARVDTHLNSSTASSGEYLSWNGSDYDWASVPAGYADSDVLSYLSGGTYAGHIIPSTDVTYDLGSLSKQWRDVYVGPGSLYVNGQKVLEDSSGTIVVSADSDQNLQMKTAGSGDIEFNPSGTGIIQAKGTLQMQDGELITNSAGNAVAFGNNITVDQITSRSTDTNLVLSGNGTGNITLNDTVNITGNLTVSGTTTTVNSETISLADNIIALNSNFTSGSPTEDSGISITRGGSAAKTFLWDETNDRWTVGSDSMVAGTFIGGLTGNVTGNADSATTLTGLTSNITELNYSDGVTSNIQTQLDAKLASSSYTASDVLTKIKTVDGAGSGLDADLLDGQSSTYYQPASTALTTSSTFGGDVSGTYNAIVIADDSYNHIISNVDGLQSALDAKYGSGSNATLGTITTSNASNAGGYVRNIYQSTSTPGSGDGAVGDLWIYYS